MSKIPHDVITDILILLPVKALLRFRCLSKLLCSLIDSPDFINHHLSFSLKTRSNLSVILRDWNVYAADFDSLCAASVPSSTEIIVHPLQYGAGTEAVGSCNGLLALRASERDLALCNPSTKKYKRLPVSEIEPPDRNLKTGYVFYGFGFDSVNKDYKLVRMATFVGKDDDNCESFDNEYEVKVYSLKSDCWKRIKGLPFYLRLLFKPFYQVFHRRGSGIFACNALHWVMPHWPELGLKNSIISFDIVTETFREVPQPEYSNNKPTFQVDVGVLEGRLCVMCNDGHERVDLWVMDEYGVKESWSKMFSFQTTKSISSLMFVRPLGYSKDGEKMLLEVNDHKLIWYDWQKRRIRNVKVQSGSRFSAAEIYVGSLVPLDDGGETEQKLKEAHEKEMKTSTKMRDDFLSVGFKLKL